MFKRRASSTILHSLFLLVMAFGMATSYGCDSERESPSRPETSTPTAKSKGEELSFRLKWVIYSSFASHFVALEEGYFQEEGLDLTIQPGGPGIDPIRLVASDVDDVGLAGYDQILIARAKGLPVVAIGEDYVRSGVGFFSLRTSGITKPSHFEGRRVGILPGTDKHTLYLALLESEKVDRAKIQEVPAGADLIHLLAGTIDVYPGFVTNQPFVAEERGAPVNVIDPYDYGVRPGGNVYFTSEKTLRERPDQLRAFLRAALRGIIDSQKLGDGEVVDVVMRYNDKLDRNAELKIWRSTKEILLEKNPKSVGLMSPEKWRYTAEISRKFGLLEKEQNVEECYTNRLVEEVHRRGLPD